MSQHERWLWGAALASGISWAIDLKDKDGERFFLLWMNEIGMGLYPV